MDTDDHSARHVIKLELELLDPMVRADPQRLNELLHCDFVEFGASGRVWSRKEIIEELPLEPSTMPLTEAGEMAASHLADDVILVMYQSRRPTADPANEPSKTANRSSIWIRNRDHHPGSEPGTWQIRFHQGSLTNESRR